VPEALLIVSCRCSATATPDAAHNSAEGYSRREVRGITTEKAFDDWKGNSENSINR